MKACPNCRQEIPDTAKVCGHCGHRLIQQCLSCGQELPGTARVCGHCGHMLADGPVSSTAGPSPAAKQSVPGWVWALVGLLLVGGVVIVLVTTGVIQLPTQSAVGSLPATERPTPAEAAAETVTPLPATEEPDDPPTSQPTPTTEPIEPVSVAIFGVDEQRVPAGTPIILTSRWIANTPEHVASYVAAIDLVVTLDGERLPNVADYWDQVEEYGDGNGDGSMDYVAYWSYPIGILSPGTHEVQTEWVLREALADGDGFDHDGDGSPDPLSAGPMLQNDLHIVVGE